MYKMTTPKIYTNNHKRDIIYGYELDLYGYDYEEIKRDYNYLDDIDYGMFFIYKNDLYCLDDFMDIHNHFYNPNPPQWMLKWHGYHQDSFFSGILVKYPYIDDCEDYGIDTDHIIVGWYCS